MTEMEYWAMFGDSVARRPREMGRTVTVEAGDRIEAGELVRIGPDGKAYGAGGTRDVVALRFDAESDPPAWVAVRADGSEAFRVTGEIDWTSGDVNPSG